MSDQESFDVNDADGDLLFTDGLPSSDPGVGYRGTSAATAAGISYRQLDYWARTNLVRPTLADASGSGLASLEGVGRLSAVRYLYLDANALNEQELLRLLGEEGWGRKGPGCWLCRGQMYCCRGVRRGVRRGPGSVAKEA